MRARLAQRPRLIHWFARSVDLPREAAACAEPLGEAVAMERGGFRWRITVPGDGHAGERTLCVP